MADNPLLDKLRIQPGQKLLILLAPTGYLEFLDASPSATDVDTQAAGSYDLVQAFFSRSAELEAEISSLKAVLMENGILWICYPKQSARQDTDLNRDILRDNMALHKLKAVSLVSIDDIWSAMRFKRV